ncbi:MULTISPECIES: hypothetical protein [Gynuella]|uniref:Uncharacterized protein n=1 Tax=Gynuella sunshinyii YC6258 TaxID=1445510 RepID=A0A0C5VWD5_9GAMM|nr:hypothetical protein [Gynuella sunshinyii]AJQ94734.1 hypothetical Protein YC6258_02696 [Gynuella sunshinyii YC6258]
MKQISKKIIRKIRPNKEKVAAAKLMFCNYANNYYGDQLCSK